MLSQALKESSVPELREHAPELTRVGRALDAGTGDVDQWSIGDATLAVGIEDLGGICPVIGAQQSVEVLVGVDGVGSSKQA